MSTNALELDTDVDKNVTRLDGFSDSDWAGFDGPEVTIEWRTLRGRSASQLFQ